MNCKGNCGRLSGQVRQKLSSPSVRTCSGMFYIKDTNPFENLWQEMEMFEQQFELEVFFKEVKPKSQPSDVPYRNCSTVNCSKQWKRTPHFAHVLSMQK